MAQTVRSRAVDQLEQVDWALEYLTRKWASVPEYARLWSAEWDDIGKVDFEMEWAIPRSWLAKPGPLGRAGQAHTRATPPA